MPTVISELMPDCWQVWHRESGWLAVKNVYGQREQAEQVAAMIRKNVQNMDQEISAIQKRSELCDAPSAATAEVGYCNPEILGKEDCGEGNAVDVGHGTPQKN